MYVDVKAISQPGLVGLSTYHLGPIFAPIMQLPDYGEALAFENVHHFLKRNGYQNLQNVFDLGWNKAAWEKSLGLPYLEFPVIPIIFPII